MLLQPNYGIFGKRTWNLLPYNLGILNACIKDKYTVTITDANFDELSAEDFKNKLLQERPDVIGLTSFSTEYTKEVLYHAQLIKEVLPNCITILGGVLPSIWVEKIINDPNIDYFLMGEGEYRFPALLDALASGAPIPDTLCGIAYRGNPNVLRPPTYFIDDLDSIPFPDYGNLDFAKYANYLNKYSAQIIPRQFPFACVSTSRGCPYKCVFCAAALQSGKKVRMRSSQNVLAEIDLLVKQHGVREIIFLDDHFLHDLNRARDIMNGLIERAYDLTWKCCNLSIWSVKDDILELMKKSGSYQATFSIESGNEYVLKHLIKKPVNLAKSKEIIHQAKTLGFEIITNFIIGTPGETWDQIRESLHYAEQLDADVINIHIATPLPKTELMELCIREGLLKSEDDLSGYTVAAINTEEFSGLDLQILRAFEWDRINFTDPERGKKVGQIYGLTEAETKEWRISTRKNLGATVGWKERFGSA